jgi:hypothetical protein
VDGASAEGDCPGCGLRCRPGDATVEVAGRLFHEACAVGGQDDADDGLPDAVEPPLVMGISSQVDSAMRLSDRIRRLRRRDRRAR